MHYGERSRKYKIFCEVCNTLKYDVNTMDVNNFTVSIIYDLYEFGKKITDYLMVVWIIAILELIIILFLVF